MNENNGKYFFIPDWLLQENNQTIHAYIFILNEINSNVGEFVTTKSEIAKALNIKESQVRTILDKMSDRSQIYVRPHSNRSTTLSIDFIGVIEDLKKSNVRPKSNQTQTEVKPTLTARQSNSFNFKQELINYGFQINLVDDWLLVRKTKKATNTETAFKSFISEIESRKCNINEMLKIAATNSWSGFKHKWVDNLGVNSNSQKPQEEKIGRTTIETIKKNGQYNGQY
jgi:hypothetical protein